MEREIGEKDESHAFYQFGNRSKSPSSFSLPASFAPSASWKNPTVRKPRSSSGHRKSNKNHNRDFQTANFPISHHEYFRGTNDENNSVFTFPQYSLWAYYTPPHLLQQYLRFYANSLTRPASSQVRR